MVLFSVFDVQKREELPAKLPQKNVELQQKTSNSRKSRKDIQSIFQNPPDHTTIGCKPYDKCKITEIFVATPGILNFIRKQEMLDVFFSEKDAPGCLNLHCETLAHQVGIIANKNKIIYTHQNTLVSCFNLCLCSTIYIYIYIRSGS